MEVEKVWLACAIDGEGSIQAKDHEGKRAPQVQLFVYNTNVEFVNNAVRILGGSKTLDHDNHSWMERHNSFAGFRQQCYRAQCSNHRDTLPILKQILPYLIIKRAKAEKAIQLLELYDWEAGKERQMSGFARTTWRRNTG